MVSLAERVRETPLQRSGEESGRNEGHGDDLFRVQADEEVLDEFCAYQLLELRHSDETARGYLQQLTAVAKQLDKKIVQVTPKDIRYKVKRDETKSFSTKQLRITAYKQLHLWAMLEEKKWANPAMMGVKSLPSPKRLAKPPISLLDARKLLAVCSLPNDFRVVYLGLYAMTRVDESARMGPEHFFGDRLTFIGKGDKERTVPVHPELAKVLPLFLHEKPKSKGVLMDRMISLRDRHNIKDIKGKPATSHSLRRTGADFLYDKVGVPREVVATLLGHGDEVTDLYAPVRFPKMKEAVFTIDYTLGEPVQLALF